MNIKTAELKQFVLTDIERKIFDTLLKGNERFRLGTTFRVAGGWVRDKLLGKQSDDLDIALNLLLSCKNERATRCRASLNSPFSMSLRESL
jgi:tRNA nucleotidyltransferase/poly(A) polymerase